MMKPALLLLWVSLYILSTSSSTTSKPTSPTSVDRHRGHRLTDVGEVGLEVVEGSHERLRRKDNGECAAQE